MMSQLITTLTTLQKEKKAETRIRGRYNINK